MDLSGALWRKATRSTNNGGACVEVAGLPGGVAVRDSKNPYGPVLLFRRDAFRAFADRVKRP
ncbi:DUF397 domain-containing protein [Actinomadura scrupuli]|uniref:DUF397 domain-containing protein n=1 Tax=Actinomadura scrupuli TaxID=559629 RepID=UPI003D9973A5